MDLPRISLFIFYFAYKKSEAERTRQHLVDEELNGSGLKTEPL